MTDLHGSRFHDLLPPNLRDAGTSALSAAVDRQMRELVEYIRMVLILADVDHIGEAMCDFLALNMDIESYDTGFPLDVKRGMVKIALRAASKKGTAAAVREVLGVIHGGADVAENWEYGGNPYCFRVSVDLSTGGSTSIYEQVVEQAFAYKNVRSHLDGVGFTMDATVPVYPYAWPMVGMSLIVGPDVPEEIVESTRAYAAAYQQMTMQLIIPPERG